MIGSDKSAEGDGECASCGRLRRCTGGPRKVGGGYALFAKTRCVCGDTRLRRFMTDPVVVEIQRPADRQEDS
jgi:hypothetical protein